ncbi:MAG: hypothetical protein JW967_01550 [Dehalococcoidales bacterium]|nr:hypothetical protein [Dehalococcoidales bacterium]
MQQRVDEVNYVMIKLIPGDIILFQNMESWLPRTIKEFFLESKWGHVSVSWGIGYDDGNEFVVPYDWNSRVDPLHVEAIGRGTLKTGLCNYTGRRIKVLRHTDPDKSRAAAILAGQYARQGNRWYDYWTIIRYVVPYLFIRRIFRKNCGLGYQHNEKFICSEMADAAYGYSLFDDNRRFPTLPGDYEYAPDLKPVWEGIWKQ